MPRMLLVPVVLGLLLAGCADTEDGRGERRTLGEIDSTSPTTAAPATDPTEEIRGQAAADAYVAWLNALRRKDAAEACSLQAPELTIALRYDAILADRAELGDPCVGFEALLWEDPGFESRINDITVTQVTAEDALLAVHLSGGEGTQQTVRMVYHRARWRVFSTEDRTGAGTDDSSGPARWVAAWCDLSPDQTRDEIVAAMGEPSGEYTVADGGEPQLWWAQDQYDFRAYLDPVDPDGPVLELVGDYDALGADDRAQLTCPELRS